MARRPKCTLAGHEPYPADNCAGCRSDALINGELRPADSTPPPAPRPRDDEPVYDPRALAAGKD